MYIGIYIYMYIYIYTIAKIHLEGSQWLRDPLAAREHRCSYVHVAFFRASFCGPPSVRPLACAVSMCAHVTRLI